MREDWMIHLWPKVEKVGDLLGRWFDAHFVNIMAILVGAWLVRRFGAGLLSRILQHTVRSDLYPTKTDREKRIRTLNSMAGAFMRVGVYIVAAILIVGEVNPEYTTALFASAGLIGVALGFGAKDLINDFMSGIFIISENQYRVGDVIEIGGTSGTVEDITIRTTVLRDLSGNVYHVPNGSVGVTTNMTLGFSQVNEDITVSHDTDIDKLTHVINHVGEELAAVVRLKSKIIDPPHFVRIDGFNTMGMTVKVVGKTLPGEQWMVKGELYRRLKTALDSNGIEIPYQHFAVPGGHKHSKK
jgi:small conductance mechanosensitive channel